MSEDAARTAAREAIARHLARRGSSTATGRPEPAASGPAFMLCVVPAGDDGEGACLVEPSVRCTHCGFCQSYGH